MTDNPTDHDNLTTLIESVNNFHTEMRSTLKDLRDNFQSTINDHEKRIQNLETTRVDFREKLQNNNGYLKWILIGVALLFGIMCWHILGWIPR